MKSLSRYITKFFYRQSQSRQGQIVVEYVLLLVVVVALAAFVTSAMVSRNPENTGFLMLKWQQIVTAIGSDPADDVE